MRPLNLFWSRVKASTLREQLKNGDVQFRKAYLNLFIDRIEVDDVEVRICGPKAALAKAASGSLRKPSDAVPRFVREWRPHEVRTPVCAVRGRESEADPRGNSRCLRCRDLTLERDRFTLKRNLR